MKDEKGVYYYPNPQDVNARVYVREGEGGVEFRLWHAKVAAMWEKHGWVPYDALKAASEMYKERGTEGDPLSLYDIRVAQALLKEENRLQRK